MKLLYGTGNLAKLSAMRNRLEQLDIELIGLNDLKVEGKNVPEVKEDGNTPLENARLKAMVYYEAFQIPVFSCDSGLYFDNVPDEVQPGVHVRNVNGKCLSDDEMIDYYSGLVKAYGNLVARYRNAICFVMDNTHIYEATFEKLYYHMNEFIVENGFVNLDFMGNLGHSIVKTKGDRVYIEKGNVTKLGDVKYFTFEPHISFPDSKYGYKKENIYYFNENGLMEL